MPNRPGWAVFYHLPFLFHSGYHQESHLINKYKLLLVYLIFLHIFVPIIKAIPSSYMEPVSSEFLRGTLKTIVLKLLSEQDKMYGYQITQAVKERTKGELTLTFGALYPVLHKLEQEGLLITESVEVEGRLRKYYSLTDSGNEVALQKISEFERFVDYMQQLFQTPPSIAYGH